MSVLDTLKDLVGVVKTAKLKSLDKAGDSVELQFNPQKDSLRMSRQVNWAFEEGSAGGDALPQDAWGGVAMWTGAEPDTLSFTTLIDETTGGALAWAAAAAKSASAMALVAAIDTTETTITRDRLTALAGLDFVVGAADMVAEGLLRSLSRSSVNKDIEKLYWLSTPDQGTGARKRPSIVSFVWGDFDFVGVITSLNVNYLVVTSPGYAKRATVDITITGRAFGDISDPSKFIVPDAWKRRTPSLL